jgi:hypothetical protein
MNQAREPISDLKAQPEENNKNNEQYLSKISFKLIITCMCNCQTGNYMNPRGLYSKVGPFNQWIYYVNIGTFECTFGDHHLTQQCAVHMPHGRTVKILFFMTMTSS